ncbi:thiopurine S-methyltransferase [Idiomarina seosinensis]|uniref:Thiopurine S-methyltransferase n=1 Tax=Idiomarina seosinensis TaxID=281739 RepID=A0A432ZDR1_9GAMM|nr:thiopurine S-methyltransferase [Idiomarina seosinensis]RUO76097.1 thiopurine S-methyltransferase [Idiomarina seosinensis]
MDASFWHERWENQQIGFHRPEPHELLKKHFLNGIKAPATVFVPLCGKSKDLLWLLQKGYRVFGVELSELAVKQFFEDNQLTPEITQRGEFKEYAVDELVIWVGDFFKLQQNDLAGVDAWYDRAAMIALPPEMRRHYVQQLCEQLPGSAKGLLITLQYPAGYKDGPPFSVLEGEVEAGYGQRFSIEQIESGEGVINDQKPEDNPVTEQVYRLD